MALRPFSKGPEIVLADGWKMAVSEAGRSAQGLKASITLSNGTDRKRHTIALGSAKQQQTLLADFGELSGLELPRLQAALAELSEAIEGALRLLEAHEPQTGKAPRNETGTPLTFAAIAPWPEAVNGAQLLTNLEEVYQQHLILPDGAARALAVWTVHTYTYGAGDITPRLGITSPLKRCGKTRVLEALSLLCPRVLLSSNTSTAAIFRAIELWQPTLLIDEADTTLPGNEELRGILNSGHTRRTAFVLRTVGDNHEPRQFSTWAPLAIAMIGNLPGTLADRSVVLPMRRKRPVEKVRPLPLNEHVSPFAELRSQCARWAADNFDTLREARPTVPAGLHDRAADNWRPLCAIAEVAGGAWPTRIKTAIAALNATAPEDNETGVLLLKDLQQLFAQQKVDGIFSEDLETQLHDMEERPWPEYGRPPKPISKGQIARLLKNFEIRPKSIRIGTATAKGYTLEMCRDPFERYLSLLDPPSPNVTPSQPNNDAAKCENQNVTPPPDVTDSKSQNPAPILTCDGVTDRKGGTDEKNVSVREEVF